MNAFLRILLIVSISARVMANGPAERVVTITPGNERSIARELRLGKSVHLISGATYVLSREHAIRINASGVVLDGQGATLVLDESFTNFVYASKIVHGDVHHVPEPKLLPSAFGIYVGPGVKNVTIKNLRVVRRPVDGTVVRSIAVVKSEQVRLQNVEMSGPTIGAIVDIVHCRDVWVQGCRILGSRAENRSGRLDKSGSGKPNLTGILIDDVDLLNFPAREKAEFHSENVRIEGCEIRDLTMDPSVGINQTDGVNVQRGLRYVIRDCVIVNCDEGIDTFASCGLIARNRIELDAYDVEASAGVKLFHGAHHNLVVGNRFVNRRIGVIVGESPLPSLDWEMGVSHNVIAKNISTGDGELFWRISNSKKGINPRANLFVGNRGANYSSDYEKEEPNFFWKENEPLTVLADFNGDQLEDVLVYEPDGSTRVYISTSSTSPWRVTDQRQMISGITKLEDLEAKDLNGDGRSDLCFWVQRKPGLGRIFLSQPGRESFAYSGEARE